jgi:hypothetical protein
MRTGDSINIRPQGPTPHIDCSSGGIDVHFLHTRQVDQHSTVRNCKAGNVVPATSDCDGKTGLAAGVDCSHDVLGAATHCNHARL